MKSVIFILYLSLFPLLSRSQINLVPNGSFEDTTGCPDHLGQISLATGWSAFRESPDYFNACSPSLIFPGVSVSTPNTVWSYQNPVNGVAYAGIEVYSQAAHNAREYLGIQLLHSLNIGEKYFFSFYVNRAHTLTHHACSIAADHIGACLLSRSYSSSDEQAIDKSAFIFSNSIITDSLNWIRISSSVVADSEYSFLSIGNFFDDYLTSIIRYDSSGAYAYYFIDDVRLSTDSQFVNEVMEYNTIDKISIYPNPADQFISISGIKNSEIEIFNLLGEICYKHFEENNLILNIKSFKKGIYFIKITNKSYSILKKVIVI